MLRQAKSIIRMLVAKKSRLSDIYRINAFFVKLNVAIFHSI